MVDEKDYTVYVGIYESQYVTILYNNKVLNLIDSSYIPMTACTEEEAYLKAAMSIG